MGLDTEGPKKGWGQHVALMVLALSAVSQVRAAAAGGDEPWPFDQRQVLLARDEKESFPDEIATAQILDAFVKEGRVRWVTQKAGPGQVVPIEVPHDFPWQSASSIRQLGLRNKCDGVVLLVLHGVQLDLRWYATLDGEPLFFETLNLPDASGPEQQVQRKKRIVDWVHDIWSRIPGQGYAVKRDLDTVSIEGAKALDLKPGQTVELRRLLEIERHPLLKTLVGIRSSVTGTATLTGIGQPLSVAHIDYESKTDPIQPGDRYVVKTAAAPETPKDGAPPAPMNGGVKEIKRDDGRSYLPLFDSSKKNENSSPAENKTDDKKDPAAGPSGIVDLGVDLRVGHLSYQEQLHDGTALGMSGYAPGFSLHGKAYLTPEWLLLADFGFNFLNFGSLSPNYVANSLSATYNRFGFAGAYRFVFLKEGHLPGEFIASLGYQHATLSVDRLGVAFAPSDKSYGGFDVGFNLQVPFNDRWAGLVHITKVLGTSLSESPLTSGSIASNIVWDFSVALKYYLNPSVELGGGYEFTSASSSFEGPGTRVAAADNVGIKAGNFFGSYTQKF